mmetsp:Transcript_30837/g.51999  ORF Transcript_30837/g.51999 Transcript_30837/m.51999 type:complete len:113 (+) Transcript_30837:136-474(+)
MWKRDYAEIYNSLSRYQWSPTVDPLAKALRDSVRWRNFHLISRSFTSISVTDAGMFLGLSPAESIDWCTQQSWQLDHSGSFLTIVQPKPSTAQKTDIQNFKRLTEYVMYLEH